MEKKLTNSSPLRESTRKHSIYPLEGAHQGKKRGTGQARPLPVNAEEALLDRRDRAAGRLVEAHLHVPQPGVVVIPPVGEELVDVEDPGVRELQIARVANAVGVEIEVSRGAEDVGDVLPQRLVAPTVRPVHLEGPLQEHVRAGPAAAERRVEDALGGNNRGAAGFPEADCIGDF
jgi:hypothetical protein